MVEDDFWKTVFLYPFSTHFWSQNNPFIKVFCDFSWATTGSKRAKIHLFEHPMWARKSFRKNDFFRPADAGGPTVGPNRARPGLPSGSTKCPLVRGSSCLVGRT